MKRKMLALVLAATMVAGTVAGCGSSSDSSSSSSSGSSDASASTEASSDASADSSSSSSGSGETVKIICGYGAGGTADLVARKFAETANQVQSDYNFIVENQTGGDGFAAATFFSEEDPDTKDLLVFGYGVAYRHDLGKNYQTEEVDFDRDAMRTVATIDDRTWILYTTPDQSLESILEKATTEGIKMSGGNPLSDCHLSLGSLLSQIGGKVTVVSGYEGGAEQKQGLVNGEVDVFVGTTQAGQDEVEAGTLIPILAFSDTAFEGFTTPDGDITVPSIAGDAKAPELDASIDFSGSILPAGGFLATHTGGDDEFYNQIEEIAKQVWASENFYGWIDSVLLNNFQLYGQDAQDHLDSACEKAIAAYELLK